MVVYCADGASQGHVYTTVLRRFSPMAVYCDEGCNPLFGGFFAYGDGASCRNEVFVMRLFCVGFCKIGK